MRVALEEEFVEVTGGRVRFDEPMRLHTTFHIGGPAQIWAEPRDAEELSRLLGLAREGDLPVAVVSGGANLLVSDEGIPGLVLHLGNAGFQSFEPAGRLEPASRFEPGPDGNVRAGAGLPIEWLIRRCGEHGLSGVEFLAGVPGRVGGAVWMNAGTHDDEGKVHSFSDVVKTVTVMDMEGRTEVLPRERIPFRYRSAGLTGRIVLEVSLDLKKEDPVEIGRRVKRLWGYKKETQDWSAPSVGCIFKNPPSGPSAGWLIDKSGLKGFQIGGAAISRIHANFIMNVGDARAAHVLALIQEVRWRVKRVFGVDLELEVQVVG